MVTVLTPEQAHIAYNVLVLFADADPEDRERFVFVNTQVPSTWPASSEYRFRGSLGFGGKFWMREHAVGERPECYVNCYPEEMTPERQVTIERVNRLLAEL